MANRLSKTALIEHMEEAGKRCDTYGTPRHERAATFIAVLCGRLEFQHRDVARALAKGAGMGHLYENEK
jgi:hypothetical protein